ncbi:hypothetical protein CS451_10750 [Salmonella enterica]|nr:hypothetical protein [Salmonella enterica subsp. enterica serovar Enteritidis]
MDNGASFDPQPGTIHGTVPPAIQHLTTEILAEEGQYQVLARWDTPRVVKGVSFSLRLNVAAEDGSDRLVSSAGTPDTQYRFRGLTPGLPVVPVRQGGEQPGTTGRPGEHTVQHLRAGGTIIYRAHPWLFPDYCHTASGGIRPDGAV